MRSCGIVGRQSLQRFFRTFGLNQQKNVDIIEISLSYIVQSLSFCRPIMCACLKWLTNMLFSLAYADVISIIFMHKVTNCNNELENTYTKFFKARAQVSRFPKNKLNINFFPSHLIHVFRLRKTMLLVFADLLRTSLPRKTQKKRRRHKRRNSSTNRNFLQYLSQSHIKGCCSTKLASWLGSTS